MNQHDLNAPSETGQKATPAIAPQKAAQVIWASLFGGLTFALLIWTLLQVAYIYRSQTNLYLYHNGEQWLPGVFTGLFSADWSFSFVNSPPFQVLQSIVLFIFCTVLGSLILRSLEVHVTRIAHFSLAYLVGFGVSGLVFELLIMAKLLYMVSVWVVWVVLLCTATAFFRYREARPVWRSWQPVQGTERNLIPFFDFAGKVERGQIDRTGSALFSYSESLLARIISGVFIALTLLFIALSCWHAWFYPETYWDSLILYLGYARMIFLEHKFPIKVTAQVGIGLGANYPHLFANYGAMASTMFGGWSDFHQRFIPPIIELCSAILVYQFAFVCFGRRLVASSAALLLVSVPYGIVYFTAASSYCLAIVITAAFLYTAVLLARTRLPGVFLLFTFWPALGMHVNYLMGVLWIPWFVLTILSFVNFPKLRAIVLDAQVSQEQATETEVYATERFPMIESMDARGNMVETVEVDERELASAEVVALNPPSPIGLLMNSRFWLMTGFCMMLGSTWYVRNYVITGNPVYAFFPEIFTGSKFVNLEVLKSAELEWYANGDGVFQAAQIFTKERLSAERGEDVEINAHDVSLQDRLNASFLYFQGFDVRRLGADGQLEAGRWTDRLYYLSLLTKQNPLPKDSVLFQADVAMPNNPHSYKLGPLFLGFALPGILLAGILIFFRRGALFANLQPLDYRTQVVGLLGCLMVLALFFAYHFLLTDMYLYQIIPIIIPLSIFGSLLMLAGSTLRAFWSFFLTLVSSGLVLLAVIVPGLPFALMNFKITGSNDVANTRWNTFELDHFRNPGMDPGVVYALKYDDAYSMWQRINQIAQNQEILTHDNRHLMYDPSITLVQLDDWAMQKLYDSTPEEKLKYFQDRKIRYYLQIPNERNHKINKRLGLDEMIDLGYLTDVRFFGLNRLMEFKGVKENLGNGEQGLLDATEYLPPSDAERLKIELEGVSE